VLNPVRLFTFAHRGWTVNYQENSQEAALSAQANKYGVEMDIRLTKDENIIMFSEENTGVLTGVVSRVSNLNASELLQLNYTRMINEFEYDQYVRVASFNETIYRLCYQNPFQPIYLNINFKLSEKNSNNLLNIMDNSPCQCDSSQELIYSSPNFSELYSFKKLASQHRCKGKVALKMEPSTYVMGEYLWLKTKLPVYYSNVDVVNVHYQIWDKHPEVLEEYNRNGYCTSVYGNTNDTFTSNVNSYKIIDVSNATVSDKVVYDPNYSFYALYIAMFVIALCCLVAIIVLFVLICRKEPPKPKKKTIDLNNII